MTGLAWLGVAISAEEEADATVGRLFRGSFAGYHRDEALECAASYPEFVWAWVYQACLERTGDGLEQSLRSGRHVPTLHV
jgi:hypothetical protein